VRYTPEHNSFEEWVYNEPDIDAAKVVWARELSVTENESLLKYFKDRRVWLLEADAHPSQLSQYRLSVNVNSDLMENVGQK
jgi:hypothetical protein